MLGPLGLLIAALATGFGMWNVLMREPAPQTGEQISRQNVRPTATAPHAH